MKQTDRLLEYIHKADAVCVGAAAGMSAAAGYDCVYHNDTYYKKYLGEFEKKYGFELPQDKNYFVGWSYDANVYS